MSTPRGLRYGWTTGACATAATKAAYTALLTGVFPDPVTITLPKGQTPAFALAGEATGPGWASASIVKDAGDDPDVTHGALITSRVFRGSPGTGVTFRAGSGVGTVTKPGLPLAVGEPAINPVPRQMMTAAVAEVGISVGGSVDSSLGRSVEDSVDGSVRGSVDGSVRGSVDGSVRGSVDLVVELSVERGEEIARSTWNPRLGIAGGLSILGTTGIVVPYSCAAWIDSIRRGIDVARAVGHPHVAACTGSTSEQVAMSLYGLPEDALLDMGDFAGAVLKYLRTHPIPRLTIAGGIGKLAKLAAGHLDLHSGRSQVDFAFLAELVSAADGVAERTRRDAATSVADSNTALDALQRCQGFGIELGDLVARRAATVAFGVLGDAPIAVDVVVIDRAGMIVGRA